MMLIIIPSEYDLDHGNWRVEIVLDALLDTAPWAPWFGVHRAEHVRHTPLRPFITVEHCRSALVVSLTIYRLTDPFR